MVAVINTSHSVLRILNYNENKIREGVAELIGQGNYPVDVQEMSFKIKAGRLQKQLELNTNVSRNTIHISLNFDPSEANISKEKLLDIAAVYMKKIGFGAQPYLVYQHHDAAHPHIHLVSIKVRADGSRIDMHNVGRNQSEKARKQIESEFGLVTAQGRSQAKKPEPLTPIRILYGKTETKNALQAVLNSVLWKYKYASIHELNAVLGCYNVMADRGSEHSRTFKSQGLYYRVLGKDGKPTGVPVKASDFTGKPTLKKLEEKFKTNKIKKLPFQSRVKNIIDLELRNSPPTLQNLAIAVKKQGIELAMRKNDTGFIYGITYVDHKTGAVFNGSSLGRHYSAKALQERCKPTDISKDQESQVSTPASAMTAVHTTPVFLMIGSRQDQTCVSEFCLLADALLQPETTFDYLPYHLKRKKRKRKIISNNP